MSEPDKHFAPGSGSPRDAESSGSGGGSDAAGGLMPVDDHGEPGGSFSTPGGSDPGGQSSE